MTSTCTVHFLFTVQGSLLPSTTNFWPALALDTVLTRHTSSQHHKLITFFSTATFLLTRFASSKLHKLMNSSGSAHFVFAWRASSKHHKLMTSYWTAHFVPTIRASSKHHKLITSSSTALFAPTRWVFPKYQKRMTSSCTAHFVLIRRVSSNHGKFMTSSCISLVVFGALLPSTTLVWPPLALHTIYYKHHKLLTPFSNAHFVLTSTHWYNLHLHVTPHLAMPTFYHLTFCCALSKPLGNICILLLRVGPSYCSVVRTPFTLRTASHCWAVAHPFRSDKAR